MKKPKPFATEAALCAAFIADLPKGWTAYAETGGWDALLVRDADGFQIGVQAKLRLNVDVINQAIEQGGHWHTDGEHPDCRSVLVPEVGGGGFERICAYVGLTIIRLRIFDEKRGYSRRYNSPFTPALPDHGRNSHASWYETATVKRHALPEYVPDVAAGSKSPLQLTDWKIRAIKLAILLDDRGHLTRHDFAFFHVDHRRWTTMRWLKIESGRYIRDCFPDFRKQHPIVYEQIVADRAKWEPKEVPATAQQPSLI